MIANAFLTCVFLCTNNADPAMAHQRLEKMLADGDTAWIAQVFRRYPDGVLGFVDHYLEGGLKMIEEGGPSEAATQSFRTGLEFAKLANEAFNEVIFVDYAAGFGSWSPDEQKRFRQGQAAFGDGRKVKNNPAEALAHYEKSLSFAEPLGDHWGMAMAYAQIAECHMQTGDFAAAKAAGMKAAELNGRLRLRMSHIKARLICGKAHEKLGKPSAGRGHLRTAWESLRDSDGDALREEVREAYCVAMEAAGNTQLAAELRAAARPEKKD